MADDECSCADSTFPSTVPEFGWRIKLDHVFAEKRAPLRSLRLKQIPELLPMFFRYAWYCRGVTKKGRRPYIDQIHPLQSTQSYGVPLGGIGCGCINRGWKGDFCRWSLIPGMYTHDTVQTDQFTVCIRRGGRTTYQQVLSTSRPTDQNLNTWNWGFNPSCATYHALYPRAWTVYHLPGQNVTLLCRQVSPILPHDYKDTSLPVAVFVWEVYNHGNEPIDVTIMFSWQNGTGQKSDKSGGRWNKPFTMNEGLVDGVLLHNGHPTISCTMAISAVCKDDVSVSHKTAFDPSGDGLELWQDLISDGELDSEPGASFRTVPGELTAAAVAAKCHVAASSSCTAEFCLAWDMPRVQFMAKEKIHNRRYTRWFGTDGDAGPSLSAYALTQYREWEHRIERWQNPILQNESLPSWYKSALFNELYFISDGGTIWIEHNKEHNGLINSGDINNSVIKQYGKFAYLEGHEYRMFNTYDVHFYASFALIMLWPQLQLSLQYDIASVISVEDPEIRKAHFGGRSKRKERNVVPHDIGDPDDEPWVRVNAYLMYDTADWKDLNLKFVLQVYRDYYVTKDFIYLQDMWPKVKVVMQTSLAWDTDGDGIIDNSGYADQTYDAWSVTGASAYCGGLWLAAVRAMMEIAKILDEEDQFKKYSDVLIQGKSSYEKKLWNGKYYNYDSSKQKHSNSIMCDQAAGQWYLRACGLVQENDEVFPKDHILCALRAIYKMNVMGFEKGTMGAVNGMRPDGSPDTTSFQSEEVWTGVTYALAANMIQEGLLEEAFTTASGVYKTCYERCGLGFQTPEAYFANNCYRSLGYMRPLAIWAMQYAVERTDKLQ
ncbi:non-lysosomal glucosylceramidase-like [Saccoglossus kowalevskii]